MGWLRDSFMILGSLVLFSEALFEDQTGKYDWRLQRVGKVSKVVFDSISLKSSVPSKVVFVGSSEENVVAAIGVKTGEIVWRQVLEQEREDGKSLNQIDSLILRDRSILSLSSGGQFLRSWSKVKGLLQWETVNEAFCSNAQIIPNMVRTGDQDSSGVVIVLACDLIVSFGAKNGQKLWDVNLNQEEKMAIWLGAVVTDENDMVIIGGIPGKRIFLRSLNTWNGARKHEKRTMDAPWFNEKKCVVLQESLVCLDITGVSLYILEMKNPEGPQIHNLEQAAAELVVLDTNSGSFATKSADKYTLFRIGSAGLQEVKKLEYVSCLTVFQAFSDPSSLYLVLGRIAEDKKSQIFSWVRVSDGKEATELGLEIALTKDQAHFVKVYPSILKNSDGSHLPRLLAVSADGDISFLESKGKLSWTRPESLSRILSVEIVDLPLSEAQANIEKEFSSESDNLLNMLVRRLTTQAIQIKRSLLSAGDEILGLSGLIGSEWVKEGSIFEKAGLLVEKAATQVGKSSIFERDYFDLHKMIVAVTKSGKLFGLDNRNGKIIWEFWAEDLSPLSVEGSEKLNLPLFVQRTTAHYPFPAQCVVIGKHKPSGQGYTVVFNPITGDVISKQVLDFPVGQAILLSYTNEEEIHGVLLTNRDKPQGIIFPNNLRLPESAPIFVMKTEAEKSGLVQGFHFVVGKGTTSGKPYLSGTMVPVWRSGLSLSVGQEIVEVAGKGFNEKVHSQGRVLGDRSVLYKYANPNLVAVVALGNVMGPAESMGSGSKGTGQMTIFMLDAVNGQVVFSAQHPRAAGPVHLVHCENWVVYSYWNEKARRTEISVLEFYEGKSQVDSGHFSSHTPLPSPPLVMRQSYVFPQGISALSVTDTEKGLTNRQILLAMPFGGILELPKSFLDPRRVLIPTRETAEEGMIPYVPDLPVATEHIVNYNQTVLHIKRIHAAPSGLESTSLVLAYGLDTYFTRITPSGTFDILKDDFDHWFISAVLTALVAASVLTKKLAKRRDLKQAWK